MAVELFIQHNSTIQFPVVEEGARLTLERKGTPGKLEFTVVKGPGLNFAEGDPVKLTVNGTAMFYGFVFKKKRDKGGTIDVVAYDQLRYLKNKDTITEEGLKASDLLKRIATDFRLNLGTVEDTGYTLETIVEENQTLFDMIQSALDETLMNTKQLYVLYDDAGKLTLKNINIRVLQDADGLLYHGWDEQIGKHIGCKWGRANAWVSVGIVEMMDYADVEPELIQALKKQLDGIGQYQKENGLWRTVLNGTMSYLEASSAYGFGYAILKGIRLGVLEPSYFALVEKMQKTLIENVDADGKVMNISAGTPVMRNEPEYNIICEHRIQPWGQGLALLYFSEAMEAEKAHAL